MAVYTDVSAEELSAHLTRYDIGELLSFKGIAAGVENSNFLLHTTAGFFILTLYEKRVDPRDLPFFIGLMEHLASRGINCPTPVKARDGAALGELAGRPAAIVTFLEGFEAKKPTVRHCGQVGLALAELHRAGEGFALARPNALSVPGWRPLYKRARDRAGEVAPGLAMVIGEELAYIEGHWPRELMRGIIHADLFTDNVFFLNDQLSGIIDFYFACNDFLAYDLAICLNAWCFDQTFAFDYAKGAAMIAGYQSVRPLSEDEAAALPLFARGSALRFLLTRLVDWLNVPPGAQVTPKDPTEYLAKLRFHQKVASPGEYGLT